MNKKHDGSLTISRPHCSDGSSYINIEVEDKDAGIRFLSLEVSFVEFSQALTGLGGRPCKIEVHGLEHVGMQIERNTLEFVLPNDFPEYTGTKERAGELAKEICPEGWTPNIYFGSQNSFFRKDGIRYARCQITRWVEKGIDNEK